MRKWMLIAGAALLFALAAWFAEDDEEERGDEYRPPALKRKQPRLDHAGGA